MKLGGIIRHEIITVMGAMLRQLLATPEQQGPDVRRALQFFDPDGRSKSALQSRATSGQKLRQVAGERQPLLLCAPVDHDVLGLADNFGVQLHHNTIPRHGLCVRCVITNRSASPICGQILPVNRFDFPVPPPVD
jgi:hypothetical protein